MIKVIFVLVVVFALEAVASDSKKKMKCIKNKFSESWEDFDSYYEDARGTEVPRIKRCCIDKLMKEGVVLKANDGQMTVSYNEFEKHAQGNKKAVGKAMRECHQGTKADDEMYMEAARACQCIFEKLKNAC